MKTLLAYLALGLLLAVAETLFPSALATKPHLLLLLVMMLGVQQKIAVGGPAGWLLGCLQDSLSGTCLGLHGLVYLVLYLSLRSVAGLLNRESPVLMLFLVISGTLLQALIMIFTLGFLAEHGTYWRQILTGLPAQVVVNLLAALFFLQASFLLHRARRRRPL
jgi:rod shape-determining protein MreD